MKHVRDIGIAIVVVAIVLAVLAVAGCHLHVGYHVHTHVDGTTSSEIKATFERALNGGSDTNKDVLGRR